MMKRISVMLTAVVLAVTAMGYSIPSLQTSGEVQLNRWVGAHGSGMLTKAFAKAKAENRPILMGFINHTSSGGGCSHCAEWINKCILTSAWNNYIATRPMVLIMFNLPDLGESKYMNYYFKYINPNGGSYPGIALYNANGSKNQVLNNTNVYKVTYKQNRLTGQALLNAKLDLDGKVISTHISKEMFHAFDAGKNETEGIVDKIRVTEGCEVAIFSYQIDEDLIKFSLRSIRVVDVSKIAEAFGGGGHIRAAGFQFRGRYEDAFEKILAMVGEQLA